MTPKRKEEIRDLYIHRDSLIDTEYERDWANIVGELLTVLDDRENQIVQMMGLSQEDIEAASIDSNKSIDEVFQ